MAGSTWQGVRGREHVTRDAWPEVCGRKHVAGRAWMAWSAWQSKAVHLIGTLRRRGRHKVTEAQGREERKRREKERVKLHYQLDWF